MGGTFDFRADGTSSGPLPGVFEETGSVVFVRVDEPGSFRPVQGLTAEFLLEGVSFLASGTKTFVPGTSADGDILCREDQFVQLIAQDLRYTVRSWTG